MLVLLAIYHLAFTKALPFTDTTPYILYPQANGTCDDINDCRKLIEIIWSCLTTIFACTWLALHPNIPPPVNDQGHSFLQKRISSVKRFLRYQVPPFLVALIAPEWLLAWAMQQRTIARQISEEGGTVWTTAHGFFVSMGGFHAFVREEVEGKSQTRGSDQPYYPLHRNEVMQMYRDGQLDLPLEAEIQDKGKTDWLAKTIIMLQTGWFIIQCIARKAAHLTLTELEVVTLAYTIMNVGIYTAWWDKPRNVDRPIRVYIPKEDAEKKKSEGLPKQPKNGIFDNLLDRISEFIVPGSNMKGSEDIAGFTGVPTFYVGSPANKDDMTGPIVVSAAVGTVFGAIHCIAWSSPFSPPVEQV
ncbi:hypothetical protein CPB86DRAFT_820042 [Serendipita vermifera]|nr:hypothetical protein CPB86DRAFT_820042 [Serendipita vermifera]